MSNSSYPSGGTPVSLALDDLLGQPGPVRAEDHLHRLAAPRSHARTSAPGRWTARTGPGSGSGSGSSTGGHLPITNAVRFDVLGVRAALISAGMFCQACESPQSTTVGRLPGTQLPVSRHPLGDLRRRARRPGAALRDLVVVVLRVGLLGALAPGSRPGLRARQATRRGPGSRGHGGSETEVGAA